MSNGHTCPTCGQHVQEYAWTILHSMVYALKYLDERAPHFVKMNTYQTSAAIKQSRSFPKLVHWGLIEKKPGKRGWWRVTPRGTAFLRGEIRVPKQVYVYNNKCTSMSIETINVVDALGHAFDYESMVTG